MSCPVEEICVNAITCECKKCPIEYHPNATSEYNEYMKKINERKKIRDRMIYLRAKSYGWKIEWLVEEYGLSRQRIHQIIKEQEMLPGKVKQFS